MKYLLRLLIVCTAPLASWPAAAQTAAPASDPRVVVPAHDIQRGETITEQDLDYLTVTPDRVRAGIVTVPADIEGREARRLLRTGELVRLDDVRRPILVAKGATVTMTFVAPGISLTATGKAMGEGGLGETIIVQNPVSFRQVACVVTAAGEVRAGGAAPDAAGQVAANP